jgi:hypothetical protein
MELARVKNTFGRWLYLEDDDFIDVVLATVVAHQFQGDPVWLFLIAPPGSGKTELLQSLCTDKVQHLTSLTPNTFVSGLNQPGKKDPSVLPLLDGQVVVIKDFTAILGENQKLRSQIFGQLRDIYDGSMAKAFGSGVGIKRYESRIGLVAGATPAIERYQTVDQVLGERFLSYRIRYANPEKAVEKAMDNAGRGDELRRELKNAVESFLSREWPDTPEDVSMSQMPTEMLLSLASTVAQLRTTVPKNRAGAVEFVPEPELATRLVIQLKKLGAALCIIRGKSEFTEDEYHVLLKVARDSLPSIRVRLLPILVNRCGERNQYIDTRELSGDARMSCKSIQSTLEDLVLLRLVERTGNSPYRWRLAPGMQRHLAISGLMLSENKLERSVLQFPGGAREKG